MVKHGGLTHVGKVRGKTPKVEKEDKPKQPRGRAFKRKQYNRRYKWLYSENKGRRKEGINSQANQQSR